MNWEELRDIPIFADLEERTIRTIAAEGRSTLVSKGTCIFRMREPVESIWIQLSGKSFLYNLTKDGSRKILFILGPGSLLNDHIGLESISSFCCDTLEKSRILQIPTRVFLECMRNDFALVQAVMRVQERKIWRLGHQLKNTSGSIYMERKLAAKLWKLQRDFGVWKESGIEIDVDLSMTFLADMMGAPRETVSKTCKALSERGLIAVEKKRITVTDPNGLSLLYHTGKMPE